MMTAAVLVVAVVVLAVMQAAELMWRILELHRAKIDTYGDCECWKRVRNYDFANVAYTNGGYFDAYFGIDCGHKDNVFVGADGSEDISEHDR